MSEECIAEENRYVGLALAEEELVARVAWCYYHDGPTQNDTGERLGLPRLKISCLLEKGRQSGVTRMQIDSRYEGCLTLGGGPQQRFDLKIAHALPALNSSSMSTRLGVGATQPLVDILWPGQLPTVGFGEVTTSCLQHLSSFTNSQQVQLVTLSDGADPYMIGIGQFDAACSVSVIPASLRIPSAEVAEILHRESSVHDVILAATVADTVMVGIGVINQRRGTTILRSGYISEGEQLMYARKGAAGDILDYFLQADGWLVEGLKIHRELFSVIPDELVQLPTVVDVAEREEKTQAIYAALTGKCINGLVMEKTTVRAVPALVSRWPSATR